MGKPHGKLEKYRDDIFSKYVKAHYVHGKITGIAKAWDLSGKLFLIEDYDTGCAVKYYCNGYTVSINYTSEDYGSKLWHLLKYCPNKKEISGHIIPHHGGFTGHTTSYFDNGKINESFSMADSKRHGLGLTYYTNGQLKSIHEYVNDAKEGTAIFYRETGTLERIEIYKDNKLHKTKYSYDENGNFSSCVDYVWGRFHGSRIYFSYSGKISLITEFRNNKKSETIRYKGDKVDPISYYDAGVFKKSTLYGNYYG